MYHVRDVSIDPNGLFCAYVGSGRDPRSSCVVLDMSEATRTNGEPHFEIPFVRGNPQGANMMHRVIWHPTEEYVLSLVHGSRIIQGSLEEDLTRWPYRSIRSQHVVSQILDVGYLCNTLCAVYADRIAVFVDERDSRPTRHRLGLSSLTPCPIQPNCLYGGTRSGTIEKWDWRKLDHAVQTVAIPNATEVRCTPHPFREGLLALQSSMHSLYQLDMHTASLVSVPICTCPPESPTWQPSRHARPVYLDGRTLAVPHCHPNGGVLVVSRDGTGTVDLMSTYAPKNKPGLRCSVVSATLSKQSPFQGIVAGSMEGSVHILGIPNVD